jgi:hypothetical protein
MPDQGMTGVQLQAGIGFGIDVTEQVRLAFDDVDAESNT